jgi:hypothetical protein
MAFIGCYKESRGWRSRLAIQPKLLPRGPCQYFSRLLAENYADAEARNPPATTEKSP